MAHEPGHQASQPEIPTQLQGLGVPLPTLGGQQNAPRFIGLEQGYFPEGPAIRPLNPLLADDRRFNQPTPRTPLYVEGMELDPAMMSGEDISDLQDRLVRAGLLAPKKFKRGVWFGNSITAYTRLLAYANSKAIDHDTALRELIEMGGVADAEEQPFTGTKKRRDTAIDYTDPTTARRLIRETLREKLGRSPGQSEYDAFMAALRAAEAQNQVVSDTTTQFVDGEAVSTHTVSQGGMDEVGFAEDFVYDDPNLRPELNAFTRDTDYYNAVLSVLRGGA